LSCEKHKKSKSNEKSQGTSDARRGATSKKAASRYDNQTDEDSLEDMNLENELNSVFYATGSAEKDNCNSVEPLTINSDKRNIVDPDYLSRSQIYMLHERKRNSVADFIDKDKHP